MKKKPVLSGPLAKASGEIETPLTNDMMFHMVMARSPGALKYLICALKGLRPEEVRSVRLLNPIDYNEYLEKQIVVDTLVELNNNEIINVELQVEVDKHWIKRSLLYLCRAYDNLADDDKDYEKLKPTTHIGIMDYDLFPEYPEFYARYLMTNVKNGNIYTSLFGMNVLSLKRIDLATEEDKACRLDHWARVFKATTWEQLKTLIHEDVTLTEVAENMYKVNADDHARSIMRARRKFDEIHTTIINDRARVEAKIEAVTAELDDANAKNEALAAQLDTTTAQLDATTAQLDVTTSERDDAYAKIDALTEALKKAEEENKKLKKRNRD